MYTVKVYSAGQLLETLVRFRCDEIASELKHDLEAGKFKVKAGLQSTLTNVLCVDIYGPDDQNCIRGITHILDLKC